MAPGAGWHEQKLLAFDLETTGVDPFIDVPVSYALVVVCGNSIVESEASLIDPGRDIPLGASAVHGITTEQARSEGMTLGIAVSRIADALLDAWSHGVPVVGMKVDYDLTMADNCLRRETGRGLADEGWCGPVLDALVIDRHVDRYRPGKRTLADLCAHYGVVIEQAHDAAADAKAAADVLRALCMRYPELCGFSLSQLHVLQESWHREWTASFAEWRARKGLSPIADDGASWPIASASGVLARAVV
jgi:DNA polymerase-3 subunit epsilon